MAGASHLADSWTWAEVGMWGGLVLAGVQVALVGTVVAAGRAGVEQRDELGVRPG
jgi:hypothetical protein